LLASLTSSVCSECTIPCQKLIGLTTSGKNRIRPEQFLEINIPLPSLEEQRRIVAGIEELAARIEEARGLRREAVEEVVLIKAAATQQLFEPGNSFNWPIAKLGEVSEIRSGVTLGRTLNGPTVRLPYLRVANVQDGYLNLHTIKEIDILNSETDKWLLQSGDILLTEGGDWVKLGRGTVWRGEIPNCIHQNHIFRVRINPAEFDPNFLVALFSSPYGKSYFQSASKQTTNLASINRRQLNGFNVFRVPLSEQRRIVAYLDDLQAKVDTLKQLQAETEAELDSLLPSILDKAFKGELV
jgi:type I restriction enzyme, S subunit